MPRTPSFQQRNEYQKLQWKLKSAEHAVRQTEMASGKRSAEYAVAAREKDEIVARMNRLAS